MDFSPIDLTVQDPSKASELGIHEGDSSMSHHCLSQLSFESGLAERMTNFTDGWSVNNTRAKFMNDVGNQMVCHEVEAFEGPARGTTHGLGHEQDEGGHVQQDDSSSSEQTAALHNRAGHTSGKRKAGKDLTTTSTNSGKISKGDENTAKCPRTDNSSKGFDEVKLTAERSTSEHSGDLSPKSLKASSKLQEPHPKQDYIHVRARRGQATDSHSLAERVRREKISERMKFLQDLVPGCSKVTGKAVMLDEIINYVQSLQRQIEFLSMKLAAVDPRLDINLENLLNKELAQARSPETTLMGPDPLAGYGDYQSHLQIQQQINNCNMDLRSVGTLCDAYLRRSMNAPVLSPLAYTDNFVDSLSQTLTGVCDGDLQTIVHMSNSQGRQEFFGQGLHGGDRYVEKMEDECSRIEPCLRPAHSTKLYKVSNEFPV